MDWTTITESITEEYGHSPTADECDDGQEDSSDGFDFERHRDVVRPQRKVPNNWRQ